jgi:hypothetical protein
MMKNKKALIVLCWLVGLVSPLWSISITGSFPLGVNQTMTVEVCRDFISEKREVIGRIPIDASGNFSFDIPLSVSANVYYFRLSRWEGIFYGQPDGQYQIEIPNLKTTGPIQFDKAEIPVLWLKGTDDLHKKVLTYYKDYNNFLEEHYFDFAAETSIGKEEQRVHLKKKGRTMDMMPKSNDQMDSIQIAQFSEIVKTFDDSLKQVLPLSQSSFLNLLHEYSMAKLYLIAKSPRTELIQQHFGSNNGPAYFHPAYVQALELYFNEFFTKGPNTFVQDAKKVFTNPIDIKRIELLLDEYHLMENSNHRLAAIIAFLQHGYNNQSIGLQTYQALLQQIADKGLTQSPAFTTEERKVCSALIENSRKCLKGWAMPAIQGKDLKNKHWDTTLNAGKLTYVLFYATWNAYAMKQLQAMEKLAIKFNGAAQFVAICMDEEESTWKAALQNKKWKTQMIYLGNQPELREELCLSNIPMCYLIDDQGIFINDYTRFPEDPQMGVQIERWLLANPDKAGKGTWKEN